MIPVRGYEGQTVAVLGLGRSGRATARALRDGGATPVVWDDGLPGREAAEAEGYAVRDLTKPGAFDGVAALITSPGIPHLYPAPHPVIAAAWDAGVPVDNDIGLFFRSFATEGFEDFDVAPRVVAVTGSNGKSTTSALIHHILSVSGRPTQLAGNIGRGVMDLDPARDGEVVVLELSSYQTDLARALTPDIAVFTNLTPDHLDRHGGYGGYFAAKRRLFAEGGPDRAVIGVDEPEGQYLANQLALGPSDDRVIGVSVTRKLTGPGWLVFVRKGFLAEWRKGGRWPPSTCAGCRACPAAHNHQNACAAFAVARAWASGRRPSRRRCTAIPACRTAASGSPSGTAWCSSTTARPPMSTAAAKALAAFPRIRWICGGLEKEGGIGACCPSPPSPSRGPMSSGARLRPLPVN
jgi:UDP-N-acetylmuramoylalanine--D-glutamate ligase